MHDFSEWHRTGSHQSNINRYESKLESKLSRIKNWQPFDITHRQTYRRRKRGTNTYIVALLQKHEKNLLSTVILDPYNYCAFIELEVFKN